MAEKTVQTTGDLTKVKPYGDTLNDGKVEMAFTLPVPYGEEAEECAKQYVKKLGFDEPSVTYYHELAPGFTFFVVYGSAQQTIDYTAIKVPKVEGNVLDRKHRKRHRSSWCINRIRCSHSRYRCYHPDEGLPRTLRS